MRILFRVDASAHIGTGHLARCLALASELRERGVGCTFACRRLPQAHAENLVSRGFALIPLGTDSVAPDAAEHANIHPWLGVPQDRDAEELSTMLGANRFDWVVVDHYALDRVWEAKARAFTERMMVIDDLADRLHDCDVLLDQNLHPAMEQRYTGKVPPTCQLLLGPRFALLRREFWRARSRASVRSGGVRRMLVFFGGVDRAGITVTALDALAQVDLAGVRVDVVIGAGHPLRREIELRCASSGHALHVQTEQMAELMLNADLSLGAGGSATWERCCLGLPCIALVTAENQRELVRDAALEGLLYSPHIDVTDAAAISLHVRALRDNPLLTSSLSARGMRIVDGYGVQRVLRVLGAPVVAVRRAQSADEQSIFDWRNHTSVREVSRSKDQIEWSAHQEWFESVLRSPSRFMLIGESDGQSVGVVRFDIAGRSAEVSIYMAVGQVGRGLGADMLQAAEMWLRRHVPDIDCLSAEVLGENAASHSLFVHAGYHRDSAHFSKRLI